MDKEDFASLIVGVRLLSTPPFDDEQIGELVDALLVAEKETKKPQVGRIPTE